MLVFTLEHDRLQVQIYPIAVHALFFVRCTVTVRLPTECHSEFPVCQSRDVVNDNVDSYAIQIHKYTNLEIQINYFCLLALFEAFESDDLEMTFVQHTVCNIPHFAIHFLKFAMLDYTDDT